MLALRPATMDDLPALEQLIGDSVRGLSRPYYDEQQIESGLRYVFGPDTRLIADGSYLVIVDDDGTIAAAGGWSRRQTLYGGDQFKDAEDPLLDPTTDAARIRAFFVHPGYARRGLGRMLFEACRDAALAHDFRELELMATMPGVPLYEKLGFIAREPLERTLPDGVRLPFVRMSMPIAPSV